MKGYTMQKLQVMQELKALIPPLSNEEYAGLEASLLADGCRDAIVAWQTGDIEGAVIVDGHNRYELCTKHGIRYDVHTMNFASLDDVKVWMVANQFARRNLPPYARAEMVLAIKESIARRAKANKITSGEIYGKGQDAKVLQNSAKPIKPINTREELANMAGVSRDTIARVEKLQDAPEETKAQLRKGELSINRAYEDTRKQEKRQEAEQRIYQRLDEAKAIQPPSETPYYLGDCLDHLSKVPAKSVRLLLTDPPYGMAYQSNRRTASPQAPAIENDANIEDAINIFDAMLKAIDTAMKDECHVLAFCNWRYEWSFIQCLEANGYDVSASLVWVKENHTSGDLKGFAPKHERIIHARRNGANITPRIPDVLTVTRQYDTGHPTEKPVMLLEQLINVTTVEGELVVDPFAGTGATAVSCINKNRQFFCVEMDEQWHTIATSRIAKLLL